MTKTPGGKAKPGKTKAAAASADRTPAVEFARPLDETPHPRARG